MTPEEKKLKAREAAAAYRKTPEFKKWKEEYYKRPDVRARAVKASMKYQKKNPEKKKEALRKSYYKNWDRRLEYRKARRKELAAKSLAYAKANPEKMAENMRRYRKNNRHKVNERTQRWRTRVRGAKVGDTKTIQEWVKSWRSKETAKCYWCLEIFPSDTCASDHIQPISKGGTHCVENLCISCHSCNSKKKDRDMDTWNSKLEQPILL